MKKTKYNTNQKAAIFVRLRLKLKQAFNAKNIVIVSEHAVGHYALSIRKQCGIALALLGIVALSSYSVGRYIQASEEIVAQDNVIENANAENEKIHNDFAVLKRDLMKMSEDGSEKGSGMSDYAQFVLEQYETGSTGGGIGAGNNPLLERINFLEAQLQQSELKRNQFAGEVYLLTKSKMRALHKALSLTGMQGKLSTIIDYRMQKMQATAVGEQEAQGGIYQPLNDADDAKITEAQAFNEMLHLSEIVGLIDELPTRVPVTRARRTSGFGRRIDPFRRTLANHTGLDFSAPIGAKIMATAAGRVRIASHLGAYGKTVDVDHGNGISTRYSHLSKINVGVGQQVQAAQVIGLQGSTGRSTGHHLHYEVRHHNVPINPDKFLMVGNHVSKILK